MIDAPLIKLLHDLMGHNVKILAPKANVKTKSAPKMLYEPKITMPIAPILEATPWETLGDEKKKLKWHHQSCCQPYPVYFGLVFLAEEYDEEEDDTISRVSVIYGERYDQLCSIMKPYLSDHAIQNLTTQYIAMFKDLSYQANSGEYGFIYGSGTNAYFDSIKLTVPAFKIGVIGHFRRDDGYNNWSWFWTKRTHLKPTAANGFKALLDGDVFILPFAAATNYQPGDITLGGNKFTWEWFRQWQMQDVAKVKKQFILPDNTNYTDFHQLVSMNLRELRFDHEEIQHLCEICRVQTPLFSDSEKGHERILKVVKK